MPYIHFTEDQKRQANAVDLPDFLRRRGERLLPSGRELRLARDHSVTVRGNEWYDHAAGRGGGPVSFLKEFCGMSYQEAVLALLDQDAPRLSVCAAPGEKERKPFRLPPANDNDRRVYAYLLQHRRIDREVVDAFVRAGSIYEDRQYHNCVFVGRDEHGAPRHAHKRSTNSRGKAFRMTVEGSDFRHAFHWSGMDGQLYVFEAPIDLLSFATLRPEDWKRHSYVALCGTSSKPLLGMLERYPNLEQVCFCLDNDQAGQLATKRLAALARERGLEVDVLVPVLKDWNADLCASFQQEQVLSGGVLCQSM